MKTRTPALLLATLCLAGALTAAGTEDGKSFSRRFGSTKAGAWIKASTSAMDDARAQKAHTGLATGIYLFKHRFEAVGFDASSEGTKLALGYEDKKERSYGLEMEGDLRLRLIGFTVLRAPSKVTVSIGKEFGPLEICPRPLTWRFMLGPVPFFIKANAGVGLEVSASLSMDAARLSLGLGGGASAYAQGWVEGGVGAASKRFGAEAGIRAQLRFGQVDVEATPTIDPVGLHGELALQITPIAFRLSLFARVKLVFKKISYSRNIYRWSAGRTRFVAEFAVPFEGQASAGGKVETNGVEISTDPEHKLELTQRKSSDSEDAGGQKAESTSAQQS
ncbi:MAG: hypothetical protein R3F30_12860 [Planctomycetota bacterium]